MNGVSLPRLYVLRATYLLIAVGLGLMIWPLLLTQAESAEHFRGVTWCLLGALGLLAAAGLRHPLKMLPLLLLELTWKTIWIVAVGLPLRGAGQLIGNFEETWFANAFGIVLCVVAIPWGYVARTYIRAPGDRWRSSPEASANIAAAV